MDTDYGYGDVDEVVKETTQGGKFMKIDNDVQYQVRIVSTPKYVLQHWINNRTKVVICEGEACTLCGKGVSPKDRIPKSSKWGWLVVDRDDQKVKILQAPNTVALELKTLSGIKSKTTGKPMWGDPRTFDILISKTVGKNGFTQWKVAPDPESRGVPVTEEEKAAILEAKIDLGSIMKGAKTSQNVGNYGSSTSDLETAPAEEEEKPEIPADLGDDTEGLEKIDPEDLPF